MLLFRVKALPASLGIFLFTDPISDKPLCSQAPVTMFINRQSSQLLASELLFPKYVMDLPSAERECGLTRLHIVSQQ